jgi:UDP-N-acetylglucosamine 3-dehydrogenase
MAATLRAAVLGVGLMGAHHARLYGEIDGVELVAIADQGDALDALATRFGCVGYRNHRELLERERPDVVSIAVPTSAHLEVALAALEAGCHVLVEKPIAASSSEGEALARAATAAGLVLGVGHIERFNPAVRRLHELIDAGDIGRITSCVARRVGVMPPRVRDADIVLDLAVHDIDIFNYLIGSYPERVRATGGRAWLSDRTDHAEILLDYGSAGCFIQVNWQTPVRIRTVAVTGESGYCELNYVTQELLHYRTPEPGPAETFDEFVRLYGESQAELVPTVRTEPLRLEIEGFLAVVNGAEGAIVSAPEAIAALRVAEQINADINARLRGATSV